MNDILVSMGMILRDDEFKKRYRVISITYDRTILCTMDITKLEFLQLDRVVLMSLLHGGQIAIEEEACFVFDVEKLTEKARRKYDLKRAMMREVVKLYEPTFEGLAGKKHRPELKTLMEKYSMPSSTFWRVCLKFFQSGMKDVSLVDEKDLGVNKGKSYNFQEKNGRKSQYLENTGVIVTEDVLIRFEDALKEYKSGRHKSIRNVYDRMNYLHYTRTELVNGEPVMVLMPVSERPTYKQLYYYIHKHLSKEELDRIKTSAAEQRNDKRLCVSDSLHDVYGPGDMVEIDAWEADISLVSMIDKNRTIGRPIVYFMIDVYTRVILAMAVALDNNSVLGVTNLFLNLADNKKELCECYGIRYENEKIWPSNIIPRRIRIDRGAEFKSNELERICVELGIEMVLAPGATGSLKGVVENSFEKMVKKQMPHLENYGLIEKRYDSKHHLEATLNIEQYTKMVLVFVLENNQKYMEKYPITREMLEKNVRPYPIELWEYGVKKYSYPRPIRAKEQYIYSLLTPVKAKISRQGIWYKDLWYFNENDSELHKEMYRAGKDHVLFEARMDMRDIGYLYYLREGHLMKASLNAMKNGNVDYSGLTMKQYDDYRKHKKMMDAQGALDNEELSVISYGMNSSIVTEAAKSMYG